MFLKKKAKYKISVSRQPLTASDKVTFKSTNKKTATVTSKGVVTAKKKGSAYITVQSGAEKSETKSNSSMKELPVRKTDRISSYRQFVIVSMF